MSKDYCRKQKQNLLFLWIKCYSFLSTNNLKHAIYTSRHKSMTGNQVFRSTIQNIAHRAKTISVPIKGAQTIKHETSARNIISSRSGNSAHIRGSLTIGVGLHPSVVGSRSVWIGSHPSLCYWGSTGSSGSEMIVVMVGNFSNRGTLGILGRAHLYRFRHLEIVWPALSQGCPLADLWV